MIIIIILFLYLRIFLAVTLWRNFNLFQMKPILSRIILLPAFGALGRKISAGMLASCPLHAKYVVPIEHMSDTMRDMSASDQLK